MVNKTSIMVNTTSGDRRLNLAASISIGLFLLPLAGQAKNIGADPPSRCSTCAGPTVSQISPTTTTISRTEGNLTEQLPLSTTSSSAGRAVNLMAVYNSYNADGSRVALDTVMGYGWTHSYNVFLFTQFGAMFRYDGVGRIVKYGVGAGGVFITANGYFETLVKNSDGSYTATTKDQTASTFASIASTPFVVGGPVWRLTKVVDRNGNTTTLSYSGGNLTGVTDTYGRTTTFSYNSLHKLTSTTDPAGRVTTFQYDSTGHKLTSITDPNGNSVQYTYNSLYQLTNKTDKAGRTFTYSYSGAEPVSVNDSNNSSSAILSNPGNWATNASALSANVTRTYTPGTTSLTDGRGNTWTYQYDSNGYPLQVTAPDSSVTTYTYDSTFHMITSMTDPRGRVTTYTVDPVTGNRTAETDPLGQTRSWTYDSHGNILTATDKNGHTTTYQYDAYGNQIKITDPLGNVTTATYDAVGNTLSRTDADGHTTSYQYDGLNRVVKETDALGHYSQTAYDGEGNRIQVTDRNGHSTTFQYDVRQRLTTATDALGHPETYTYDANDNRISVTDRDGHTTTFQYDLQNRLSKATDALNDQTSRIYDGAGNVLSITDANSHTTTNTYDTLNRLATQTDAAGDVTRYQYDTGTLSSCSSCGATPGSTLVTGRTDGDGNVTYYKYDALDRRIDIVRKNGSSADTIVSGVDAVTTYTYDAVGNRLSLTEPDGNTTVWQYDSDNRTTKATNAAGDVTLTTYDGVNNVITMTAPNLNVTTNQYDALNRLTQVTDSVGLASTYTYDSEGNRLSAGDGNGNITTTMYDAINRAVTTTDPAGQTTTTQYDAVGNVLKTTDRNGNVTTYTYDAINRRTSTTDALGNTTQSQFDPVNNLTRLIDGNSHATQYTYDAVNRLTRELYADGNTRTFAYDAVGNVITRTDQNGNLTSYTYSPLYFLVTRTYPSAVNDSFTYDLSGRLLSSLRGSWSETYTYDGANRLTQTVQNGQTISYVYNIPGRTRQVTYPGGRAITEYTDARSRLDHINDASPLLVQYVYDPGDRVRSRAYRNGVTAAFTYSPNNWILSLQHSNGSTPVAGFTYTYDFEGNKQYEDKLQDSTHSEAYQYDTTYRLTNYAVGTLTGSSIPAPSTQTAYNLDPLGNWTSKVTNSVTQTRTHNVVNEITGINSTNLTYDADGNLLNDGTYAYTWDEENRLTAITRLSDSVMVGQYLYDAAGRRVQKTADPVGSPVVTQYFYDAGRVIEEQNPALSPATQATYVYGSYIDEILSMTRSAQTYYFHQNALWSVEAVTDSTGNPAERYSYDAYGSVTPANGSGTPLSPNAWGTPHSAIGNPWMFTGRQMDEEDGLFYYRARYYDPGKGRFLEHDPLGYVDGLNLYEYVGDQPTTEVDPSGMAKKDKEVFVECTCSFTCCDGSKASNTANVDLALGTVTAGTILKGGAKITNFEGLKLVGNILQVIAAGAANNLSGLLTTRAGEACGAAIDGLNFGFWDTGCLGAAKYFKDNVFGGWAAQGLNQTRSWGGSVTFWRPFAPNRTVTGTCTARVLAVQR